MGNSDKQKLKSKLKLKQKGDGKSNHRGKKKKTATETPGNSNNKEKINIYDACELVFKYMKKVCRKNNIEPAELYEELHYQLPSDWVESLREIMKHRMKKEVKEHYDIESSNDSSCYSDCNHMGRSLPSMGI